jgi:hypothetical protein
MPTGKDSVQVAVIISKDLKEKLKEFAKSRRWSLSQAGAALAQSAQEHTRDIDVLSERIGDLAQSVSELKQDRDAVWTLFDRVADGMLQFQAQQAASREALDQLTEAMLQFQAQAVADRAVMLEILQYLRNQYPGNGRSGAE